MGRTIPDVAPVNSSKRDVSTSELIAKFEPISIVIRCVIVSYTKYNNANISRQIFAGIFASLPIATGVILPGKRAPHTALPLGMRGEYQLATPLTPDAGTLGA
jgi:hypothetical protein